MVEFNFNDFENKEEKPKEIINPALSEEKPSNKKSINFQEMPKDTEEILNNAQKAIIDKFSKEEPISMPYENSNSNSYLSLVLSPNFRELELMIRGLEYVKRFNPMIGKEEIILRKIPDHPLNEYGINKILQEIKLYASPEIKLGRKRERDYYLSIRQVSKTITRLIYKNLKRFGMDTQEKQRNAKTFCLAIIELVDASYSRSIGGRENDLSRGEIKIEGTLDGTPFTPATLLNRNQKEALKN